MENLEKLNKINEDAGQRCSNALSKILKQETQVTFFQPRLLTAQKIFPFLGLEELGVGIYLPIKGNGSSSAVLLFPNQSAFFLCDIVMKRELGATRELSSFDNDLLKEMGNILLGNYLAIISNALGAEFIEGMPNFSSGMLGAITEEIIANFAQNNLEALVIEIEFMVENLKMKGYLLLLFSREKIESLLSGIGQ